MSFPPIFDRRRMPNPPHVVDEATGCWVWQRTIWGKYGVFVVDGKRVSAHRYYYEHFVGPIPEGLQIDHLCRNTRCVNPAHLEPVTQRENVRRHFAAEHGDYPSTHCPHGHEFTPDNLIQSKLPRRDCRACQRERLRKWRERQKAPMTDA